ncbi:MAG: rhodanese-like domain-containing protein [Candidatus Limiplasma sp.]|nr:rhodanese-like domain-containing protein [Candidatus Limiplasma sp.]
MTLKRRWKPLAALLALVLVAGLTTACNTSQYAESGRQILPAASLSQAIGKAGVVIVDMQDAEAYATEHVQGAVNITKDDILINIPVQNMLTSKNKLQKLLSDKGIANDTQILVYDDNRMNAARFFWTMLMYGNQNVQVVDGGLKAIRKAGVALTSEVPAITATEYVAGEKDGAWLASQADVLAQVNEPDKNTILLDVRTDAEYQEKGKIPSSILWDYADQFYEDGTFKDVETTRINFMNKGMRPENRIIVYCQTSMRAAPVFLQLYNAGYRNIQIYDGAYLEWSSNPNNPVDIPSGMAAPSKKDAS